MNKVYLISISLLFLTSLLKAQGEYDKCYFGTAAIDFSGWIPIALTNSGMEARESAASICNDQGDLLFYSNGGNSPTIPGVTGAVWNSNHQIMENGILSDSSGCVSSFQGAVAVPSPANNNPSKTGLNTYYLFVRDCAESSFSTPNYNSGLTYCLIDMDQNGGLGKVVEKNQIVVPFSDGGSSIQTSHEPVAAVRNENNVDWWIFSYNNDSLHSVELTENGIGNYQSYDIAVGAITISPRRDKIIAGEKLFDFDAINGQASYLMTLDAESASFSSDGTKLYTLFNGDVFQYDIEATNIEASKMMVASVSSVNRLYLAPDARIYFFKGDSGSLPGYIECPNNTGLDVGVTMNAISLNGKNSGYNFTNIPACYLYRVSTGQCNASLNKESASQNKFTIKPNPASKVFSISNDSNKELSGVKIIASDGRYSMKLHRDLESPINISKLSPGIYFVHLIFDDEVIIKKLVVK